MVAMVKGIIDMLQNIDHIDCNSHHVGDHVKDNAYETGDYGDKVDYTTSDNQADGNNGTHGACGSGGSDANRGNTCNNGNTGNADDNIYCCDLCAVVLRNWGTSEVRRPKLAETRRIWVKTGHS